MALLLSSSSPHQVTRSTNAWVVKKVREKDFDDIFEPIEQNPSLVWETNARGWTCLHIACATTTISQRWWEWLLYQACVGHEKLRMAETENGQTPIDLYFRTNLFPYAWQDRASKESAKLLKDAISLILCSPYLLHQLRLCIIDSQQDKTMMMDCGNTTCNDQQEEKAIERVLDFWQRMECLLTVTYYGRLDADCSQKLRTELVLAFANLSWCPQMVVELGIRLFPPTTRDHASQGLEIWAATKSSFERYPEGDRGSLPVLCQYYLFAAPITTVPIMPTVSWPPLNVALRMGKRWKEVKPLFDVFPDTVYSRDVHHSGLPVFCLPATAPVDEHEVEMTARWGGQQTGVWHYLSPREKEQELAKARETVDRERLETIYQLLRRNPSALIR